MVIVTTIRRDVLTLPAADLGPSNPLPPLLTLDEAHRIDERDREGLPRDMARQIGYEPLHSVLPERIRDGYGRARAPRELDAVVIENDRLRATVLPGLGGRIVSLLHKPTERELLYRNPVVQPACFALNGAWFSGGIEWNIGATGHTTLSCSPLHAARVPAPDGGEMLRLWEWERLRDLPFQVDLWLPDGSDFLYVGVRVRNPHERPAPVYWWSNIAVPEERRVLAPADEAWHFGYERRLRRIPVPSYDDADRTYPLNSHFPADFFYEVPDGQRRWIAAVDEAGDALVQTSTDLLRGRKLFVWGSGPGGRRWQEWLTEPGTGGYCEIQAGLARTQLEHVRLEAESEFSWLEAYGPLTVGAEAAHGEDWAAARAEAESRLEDVLPRRDVDAAYAAWLPHADTDPGEVLAVGSGWGALEVLRSAHKLPGTPFEESTLGEAQAPWLELLRTGAFPEPRRVGPPGETLVAPHWRDMLETAPAVPLAEYHLGVAQWHAGDSAQAVRSWERALELAPSLWPLLRCLAVADAQAGNKERAADRYVEAFDDLCRERRDSGEVWTAVTTALGREAVEALLAVRRTRQARSVWERLGSGTRARGRFRLIEAQLLLAEGDVPAARAVFDEGFEVADLREGAEVMSQVWARLTDDPLPARYEFRMRPPTD
ncbi:DUF5107 domain-containing protein [Streptomyces sp. Tue6028]|uniref:DUF5107 domain-containing protein n=1 Tax=Streptomyces sp. Tue6028 TaxID=2036037 RepID=UPI000BB3CB04|nr:DUF5107 domain-containing protein [Streptomyces sp. Tue6028]PBC60326.1 DUF5107 domain-containing protein [Streptomyces sp. Tue6028]